MSVRRIEFLPRRRHSLLTETVVCSGRGSPSGRGGAGWPVLRRVTPTEKGRGREALPTRPCVGRSTRNVWFPCGSLFSLLFVGTVRVLQENSERKKK